MVKPKNEPSLLEFMRAQNEKFERESPVLATRWYVIEHTPARREHDGYDHIWTRDSNVVVSPYFENEEEAVAWMEAHVADEGKELKIKHQNLREFRYRQWGR